MPDSKLIAEFDKCSRCGCTETVTKVAIQPYKDSGKIPQEAPVASRRVGVPLVQPTQVALTVPLLSLSYDNCLECGLEYLVRAEVINAPVTVKTVSGQTPFGQMPPGFP